MSDTAKPHTHTCVIKGKHEVCQCACGHTKLVEVPWTGCKVKKAEIYRDVFVVYGKGLKGKP